MPDVLAPTNPRARTGMRVVLELFYFAVDVLQLRSTAVFVALVKCWVPNVHTLVLATGCCELLGTSGWLISRFQRFAGIMRRFTPCVWFWRASNQAITHFPMRVRVFGWNFQGLRLAERGVRIWWTLFCTGIVDRPFQRTRGVQARTKRHPVSLHPALLTAACCASRPCGRLPVLCSRPVCTCRFAKLHLSHAS